jgi:hypothetical protein
MSFIGKIGRPEEIVISDQTISRVLVEETITSDQGAEPLAEGRLTLSSLFSFRRVLIALCVIAILGSVFWFYRGQMGFRTAATADMGRAVYRNAYFRLQAAYRILQLSRRTE